MNLSSVLMNIIILKLIIIVHLNLIFLFQVTLHVLFRILKKIIEFLCKDLNGIPIVKYYSGNNKIIIEFKEDKNNKALLLINPLDEAPFINKAYILLINDNNQKINLYKGLLNEIDNSNCNK